MMDFPMKAFCLGGYDEKIEITINEIYGFPNETGHEGGYDFKGDLDISIHSYEIHCKNNFYSTTGILYNLLTSLKNCYTSLDGKAEYVRLLENDLHFVLKMTDHGHAVVNGSFQEYSHLPNKFIFQMETDQTCILSAIKDLEKVAERFGGHLGWRSK